MQKMNRVAAAVALLLSGAALAEVQVGGELKIGVASLDMEGTTGRKTVLDTASSYLSVRGEETLSEQTRVFFDISTRLCLDGNQVVANDCRAYDRNAHSWKEANNFASREGWLGVRNSQYGEFKIGRGKTPFDEVVDRYDPSTGIGTGMSAWVERVYPATVPLKASNASAVVSTFAQQVYGLTYAQAVGGGADAATADAIATASSTSASQTLSGALAQQLVPAILAQFPVLPTIGRYTEPDATFSNAIRYNYGSPKAFHVGAMYGTGEDKTASFAGASRLSLNVGYANGEEDFGQFRIDAVFDYQKNLQTEGTADQIVAGLAAAQAAASPQLSAALQAGGIPAALADPTAAAALAAIIDPAAANYTLSDENSAQHLMLASSYVFPFGRLGLVVDRIVLAQGGLADAKRTNWALNWELGGEKWGAFLGYRKLGETEMGGLGLSDSERKIGLGAEYYLSKRTKFITEYNNNRIEGGKVVHTVLGGIVHKF